MAHLRYGDGAHLLVVEMLASGPVPERVARPAASS
jgi:hypothetical protein